MTIYLLSSYNMDALLGLLLWLSEERSFALKFEFTYDKFIYFPYTIDARELVQVKDILLGFGDKSVNKNFNICIS